MCKLGPINKAVCNYEEFMKQLMLDRTAAIQCATIGAKGICKFVFLETEM